MIPFHRMLLADTPRMTAYRAAILAAVRPGDVVLDIGTGTGILAFFACQAGARRVYAVERSDIVSCAKQLAEANLYSDRIVFIEGDVESVTLPERVDVITSELISKMPVGERMSHLTAVCRERFLKPSGRIVPRSVAFLVAPVEVDAVYEQTRFPERSSYGVDFSCLRQYSTNLIYSARCQRSSFLGDEQKLWTCDLLAAVPDQSASGSASLVIARKGVLHGICCWFAATLAEGVDVSNAPPGTLNWDNAIFPLTEPVPVEPGMTVQFRLTGDDRHEIRHDWVTTVMAAADGGGADRTIARYRQSSTLGAPLRLSKLRKTAHAHKPVLGIDGQATESTLSLMDGTRSLDEIAREIATRFPGRFSSSTDAWRFVAGISAAFDKA